MNVKVMSALVAIGFGVFVVGAGAGEGKKCCKSKQAEAQKVAAKESKGCCKSKKAEAQKVAAKDSKGCCSKGKKAMTASAGEKKPCSASKAAGGCSKSKAATTVAAGEGKKGCCSKGKKAMTASADEKKPCSASKAAAKGGCSKKCGMTGKTVAAKEGGCPIGAKVDAILASMPEMKYSVGEKTMCCPKAAKYAAEKEHKTMMYTIGKEHFKSEGEAMAKLASMMEEEIKHMQSVRYSVGGECSRCPMTAKSMAKKSGKKMMYTVAGVEFECSDKAAAAAKAATEAASEVKMAYKVGDKTFPCSKMAGSKCKKDGAKMTYLVGDDETCCETQAKILHAKAQVRAMVQAAMTL
ncbi:MAG: hypothetical protein ACPGXK_04360 [Phycisphaerae bacterium]